MNDTNKDCTLHLFGSERDWFDGKAVEQLRYCARLEGMRHLVGFPDMHAGLDAPNGAAFISEGILYPHLIGNDIGCGYALWQSDLPRRKLKADRWAQRLHGLDQPYDGDTTAWIQEHGLQPDEHASSMGTIGGGNHFAELQEIHSVCNANAFTAAGLNKDNLFLLVHSGSRGLGQTILRSHTDVHRTAGLAADSAEAAAYLLQHNNAMRWAVANRALIASRFAQQLNAGINNVLDLPHNWIEPQSTETGVRWLHRKGASPADQGLAVVPGSRGTLTYLVMPLAATPQSAASIAHGAGRRWDRHATEARLRARLRKEALLQTELGGRVICEDKSLLFQEAPQAYKNIETVINIMEAAGLIQTVATLRPVITYKKRNSR